MLQLTLQHLLILIVFSYAGCLLAARKSERVRRELGAVPFVPAYEYEPPCRRAYERKV